MNPSRGRSLKLEANTATAGTSGDIFISKGGYYVNSEDDRWCLSKDVTVNLSPVVENLNSEVVGGFRSALVHYAQNFSANHVHNITNRFNNYVQSTGADRLTIVDLTNYRGSLSKSEEHKLGVLKGFLITWFELGYPGIHSAVIETLKGWRLKGNKKGSAVRSLDPKKGPLDDIELEGLNVAAAQLFEQQRLELAELGQLMLLTHLGTRPIQVSHLRIKDLVLGKKGGDDAAYVVMMPQAKQQGEEAPFRGTLKPKKIRKQLWDVLRMQAEWVNERITPLSSKTVAELPLFPNLDAWPSLEKCSSEDELCSLLVNDCLHIPTRLVNAALKSIVRRGNVRGRDGELLTLSPRRLRYTTGSRAAREGFGKWVIANLLDHKDTQNAGVYTDNHPNFTKAIDKAMSQALAPLAQAYMGTLVGSKVDARYGDDPRQQITDGTSDIGVCGSHGYCGAVAPIACYTCIHFQPMLEAPHGEVLERLLVERERVKDYTNDEDDVVVGATDRTILAVSQVILLCEKRRGHAADEIVLKEVEHG